MRAWQLACAAGSSGQSREHHCAAANTDTEEVQVTALRDDF